MENIKVNDYIIITYTEDNDLNYWLEEQENKGIKKHKIIEIDKENGILWLENCEFSIWYNEDLFYKVEDNK